MRHASLIVGAMLAVGCGTDDPGARSGAPVGDGGDGPEAHARPADPFNRVTPEQLKPALDSAYLECEAGDWVVVAEVAGRASSARAVVVRTVGDPMAIDLPLELEPLAEGSLWTRFASRHADAVACDRAVTATVIEAFDASGAPVDCVAFGNRAGDVVAGALDAQLGDVPRGAWTGCRVR